MKPIVTLVIILPMLALGVWWEFYKYKDCKKVGHTTTYCVLKIGAR